VDESDLVVPRHDDEPIDLVNDDEPIDLVMAKFFPRPWQLHHLTSKTRGRITSLWSGPQPHGSDKVGGQMSLRKKAFWTIQPGEWLDEEAGDRFISLFHKWLNIRFPTPRCCLVTSSFLRMLGNLDNFSFSNIESDDLIQRYSYPKARDFFLPGKRQRLGNLFLFRHVLLPYCGGNHWFLIVVDTFTREIYSLDSMSVTHPQMCKLVEMFLSDYEKEYQTQNSDLGPWRITTGNVCPKQSNGYDCGIFTMVNMLQIGLCDGAHDGKFHYNEGKDDDDMPGMREYIADIILADRFSL
jgi:hypothetical protein